MPEYGAGGFTASGASLTGSTAPEHEDDGSRAVIDVHHHFCAPQWREWGEARGLVNPGALPPWAHWDAESALALMDRAGIATAVLKPMLPARYESSAQLREAITVTLRAAVEAVEAHPGRFFFHTPLFLDDPEVSSWALRHGLDELGAVGVNVTANYGGVYLGDPVYDGIFAELDERSAVVDTHPHNLPSPPSAGTPAKPAPGAAARPEAPEAPGTGRPGGPGGATSAGRPGPPGVTVPGVPNFLCDFLLDTTRAAANMIRNRTLDRFPHLSVILPHGGGFLPHIATRLEAFAGSFDPPVDPAVVRDHLHRFYYDTAGPMSPAGTLLATVDPSRILFGSDWPACPADMVTDVAVPALASDPALTPALRRAVNRENALRLMPRLVPA
ncbi:amidohydrolase [Streptomyces sp. WAC07061]|uniref:amidohydrolase family protein n=1 Tax=Streptomyces sp. WAC07061 TaxID=2487410 RepID=UPI000F78B681|nr:amidohydrolase family protein [Streptomyces sp. WAC07061]RSS47072.1 amidohydrolase [Streptomyces sp. WAC07061]